MKPLINSPGHVKALEFLQELHKTGPAAQVGWSLGEAWDYFLRGKAVFVFSLGRRRRALPGRGRSKVKGKCAAAVLPSSNEYYDFEKKEFVKLDKPRLVGNTTGGSWHGVVSNFSANPEATYSFLSLMAIQPVSKLMATVGWDGVDPGFSYQFLEEDGGTAKIEDYVEGGLGRRTTPRPTLTPITRPSTRRDHAALSAHPRLVRILGHPGQEPVGGDERRRRPRSRRSTTRRRPGSRSPTGSAATSRRPTIRRPSATQP